MIRQILSYAWPFAAKPAQPISENDERLFQHVAADDVFLTAYPGSGNTWVRCLLMSYRYPDRDLDTATIQRTMPDLHQGIDEGFFAAPGPRIVESHSLYCDAYPKVLYVLRDGRDCYWSYYTAQKQTHGYEKSFERFFYEASAGHVWPSSWHDHVQSWIEYDDHAPMHIVRFEDLLAQPLTQLKMIVAFIGWSWDEASAARAIQRASRACISNGADEVDKHDGTDGQAGAWRDVYSPRMRQDFEQVSAGLLRRFGYDA